MRHLKYLRNLLRHKWFVFLECCKLGIPWLGIVHDLSKFSLSEWDPYSQSFAGKWEYKDRPKWLVDAFDVAWLHHQKRNRHHWQYWHLYQDSDPDKVLPIPDRYRREMLADWRGASRAYTGGDNTKTWYSERTEKMKKVLHPDTRAWIEEQLEI